jgi:phosphopantothenoylcysteine decarboxylase/phosphopantothenate--cysteine ligase
MKVLITAGPTQESIDPVRYLTNHSSGKMGYALAKAALKLGFETTLISGPVTLEWPKGALGKKVTTAEEMFEAVSENQKDQDIMIMCAAVADYRPEEILSEKRKKSSDNWTLSLRPTKDILKHLGETRRDKQLIAGFALETENILENARNKLLNKKSDVILANDSSGLNADKVNLTWLDAAGAEEALGELPKETMAEKVMELLVAYRQRVAHA